VKCFEIACRGVYPAKGRFRGVSGEGLQLKANVSFTPGFNLVIGSGSREETVSTVSAVLKRR